MSWRVTSTLAALGLLAAVSISEPVRAEVRVRAGVGQAELQVQPTSRGVWSPVGQLQPELLNPSGDLLGDGHPAHARCDGRITAAWFRPVSDELILAEATESGWELRARRAAPAAVGSPQISCSGDRVLLAWTSIESGLSRVAIDLLDEGPVAVQDDALLLDSALSGDAALVLTGETGADGSLVVVMGVLNPPGVPIDINRSVIGVLAEPGLASAVRAFAAEELGLESGSVLVTLPDEEPGQLRLLRVDEQGTVLDEDVLRSPNGGSEAALLARLRKAVRR